MIATIGKIDLTEALDIVLHQRKRSPRVKALPDKGCADLREGREDPELIDNMLEADDQHHLRSRGTWIFHIDTHSP